MKREHRKRLRTFLLLFLVADMVFAPVFSAAGPRLSGLNRGTVRRMQVARPAVDALPQLNETIHQGGAVTGANLHTDDENASLEIQQTQANIVINWNTFNIGEDARVSFVQREQAGGETVVKTNWSALNRIWDRNPSAIFGQLDADGRIFLINQNGILFGPDSRVNVHTLVATSLDIVDGDDTWREGAWKSGTIGLRANNYQNNAAWDALAAEVVNEGHIRAESTGAIFLVGPTVENAGTIETAVGQIGLVAGSDVELYNPGDQLYRQVRAIEQTNVVGDRGQAVNTGRLLNDQGMTGMYGRVVNQEGLIRNVTAIQQNGRIELRATESIHTAAGSRIEIAISDDPETFPESTEVLQSTVDFGGLTTRYVEGGSLKDRQTPPASIEHGGDITAPAANVTMKARDAITLYETAVIDVSGLWTVRSASENQLEVQLNSPELADAFQVREGDLRGETVYINALEGSSIGNIDGHLNSRSLTAREMFTQGGTILLDATQTNAAGQVVGGEIDVRAGARIDFSGGGYNYSEGQVKSSWVRFENQVFNISDVPDWVIQQGHKLTLLSDAEALRMGLPIARTVAAYQEGHDAGTLNLLARKVSLAGRLDGSVTRGIYQTLASDPTKTLGDLAYQTARGLREPLAGTLLLGSETEDRTGRKGFYLDRVAFVPEVSDGFDEDTSVIDVDVINAAGLGRLAVHATNEIRVAAGATLALDAGYGDIATGTGSTTRRGVEFKAQNIEIYGGIVAPGGHVDLEAFRMGSAALFDRRQIVLGEESFIDVSGQELNYFNGTADSYGRHHPGYLQGGTISMVNSHEVGNAIIAEAGSLLDVSGGYLVDYDGKTVTGADAGSIVIEADRISLDAGTRLAGHSLVGYDGGRLSLAADAIALGSPPEGSDFPVDGLVLAPEALNAAGMSHVSIEAANRLSIAENLTWHLAPRKYEVSLPDSARLRRAAAVPVKRYVTVTDDTLLTPGSLVLAAGSTDFPDAAIQVPGSTSLSVNPGGTIAISAPRLDVYGKLKAAGGTVDLATSRHNLTIHSGAKIDVAGIDRARLERMGSRWVTRYDPQDGGAVFMTADDLTAPHIVIESGATIDVSGSQARQNIYADGVRRKARTQAVAGNAGQVYLTAHDFDLSDEVDWQAFPGLALRKGGDLSLFKRSITTGDYLAVDDAALGRFSAAGFDALTLRSLTGIQFTDAVDAVFGRQIVLDAPRLVAPQSGDVYLNAPYMVVTNDHDKYLQATPEDRLDANSQYQPYKFLANWSQLEAALTDSRIHFGNRTDERPQFAFNWLDIDGAVAFQGFKAASIDVLGDVTLSDQPGTFYRQSAEDTTTLRQWVGQLMIIGDLDIRADRVYPTTNSAFTLSSGYTQTFQIDVGGQPQTIEHWIGGDIAIHAGRAGNAGNPIYSAGGRLRLEGREIAVEGTLAAPMGSIELLGYDQYRIDSAGRPVQDSEGAAEVAHYGAIRLSDSGRLTTSGGIRDADGDLIDNTLVLYGNYDKDQNWTLLDKDDGVTSIEITAVPEGQGITLDAATIETAAGSLVDVAGGGLIFAYNFVPSTEGSADPLARSGRYVIVPGLSQLPGQAVYLEGIAGLPAGTYSLLPEAFAFVEGAIVIEDLGVVEPGLSPTRGLLGEDLVGGWFTYAGTGIQTSQARLFSVRSSTDVLGEGRFEGDYQVAGDGSSLSVAGRNTTLDGHLRGYGLDGYNGGSARFSAAHILVSQQSQEMIDTLILRPGALNEAGFETIELGGLASPHSDIFEPVQAAFALLDDATGQANGQGETQSIRFDEGTALDVKALGLYGRSVLFGAGSDIRAEEMVIITPGGTEHAVMADGAAIGAARMGIFGGELQGAGDVRVTDLLALGSEAPVSLAPEGFAAESEGYGHHFLAHADLWHYADAAGADAVTRTVAILADGGLHLHGAVDETFANLYVASDGVTVHCDDDGSGTAAEETTAAIRAANIHFEGLGDAGADGPDIAPRIGRLLIEATDTFTIGGGTLVDAPSDDVGQVLSGGGIYFAGAAAVELKSGSAAGSGDMLFGLGELHTDADLMLTAGRLTSTCEYDDRGTAGIDDDRFLTGLYTIASGGAVTVNQGEGTGGDRSIGGSLEIVGDSVFLDGTIDLFAGQVFIAATGSSEEAGLFLGDRAHVSARGGAIPYAVADQEEMALYGGGLVALTSNSGFRMAEGALIDVSNAVGADLIAHTDPEQLQEWIAAGQLDAGSVIIQASSASLLPGDDTPPPFGGTLAAAAGGVGNLRGKGGLFALEARRFDYDQVAAKLGDFTGKVALTLLEGDMRITTGLRAEQIRLVAEGLGTPVGGQAQDGNIHIAALLDASGAADNRRIEIYAYGDVNLNQGGALNAAARLADSQIGDVDGGEVIVSSAAGWIRKHADADIDVSALGNGLGGKVHLRAGRYDSDGSGEPDDVRMDVAGHITGAGHILAEAVESYDYATLGSSQLNAIRSGTAAYMAANGAAIRSRLSSALGGGQVDFRPGIEVVSSGDLRVSSEIDLNQGDVADYDLHGNPIVSDYYWRYGDGDDAAGILTLRAAGNLYIDQSITDAPQSNYLWYVPANHELIYEPDTSDSWDYTLTAGARVYSGRLSADPLAVTQGGGDLIIADNRMVYTESGALRFAAGGDVLMTGRGGATPYLVDPVAYGLNQDLAFSLGTFDGRIEGTVGENLRMTPTGSAARSSTAATAIQTATGNIELAVGGNVVLGMNDAIRTTGKPVAIDRDGLAAMVAQYEELAFAFDPYLQELNSGAYGDAYAQWKASGLVDSETEFIFFEILQLANSAYWDYSGGGTIRIGAENVGTTAAEASLAAQSWMRVYYPYGAEREVDRPDQLAAVYSGRSATGIFTMAGGDLTIEARKTIATLPAGTFGQGDLTVRSGLDMDGRFLVAGGTGTLTSMGNYGLDAFQQHQALELLDARVTLTAQGDISLGAILTPTLTDGDLAEEVYVGYGEHSSARLASFRGNVTLYGDSAFYAGVGNPQPAERLLPAALSISAAGDIRLLVERNRALVLAPSASGRLDMVAGGDIRGDYNAYEAAKVIMSDAAPEMYYADYQRPEGYTAAFDFDSHGFSDAYVEAFLQMWESLDSAQREAWQPIMNRLSAGLPLHFQGEAPDGTGSVRIHAGHDIYRLRLDFPTAAHIRADHDIIDLFYVGQNVHADDITSISAGNDIRLAPYRNAYGVVTGDSINSNSGIRLGGPGSLVIDVGRTIDLGQTRGIETYGASFNSGLTAVGTTGADVIVLAGYDAAVLRNDVTGAIEPDLMGEFFDDLRQAGVVYSALKYGQRLVGDASAPISLQWALEQAELFGLSEEFAAVLGNFSDYADVPDEVRNDLARLVVEQARADLIDAFFPAPADSGDALTTAKAHYQPAAGVVFEQPQGPGVLSMTQSQIVTEKGGDIFIAAADRIDVGRSVFGSAGQRSGINAKREGDVNIFSHGDINVNESRIMTWYGGDITIWSDSGDINAGKGSRTAVSSATYGNATWNAAYEIYLQEKTPPVVGSGIRILTHDPDGVVGPAPAADPGNGYLFAPDGEIDAGEAGIKALGNLLISARRVRNIENIDTGGASVGEAARTDVSTTIGSLAGAGNVNPADAAAQGAEVMASAKDRFNNYVAALSDSLVPKWLAVEVIGFSEAQEREEERPEDSEER